MGARLWLAAGVVCIAWSAIFVRLAGVPGGTSAFYRLAIGAAVLVPIWLARREKRPSSVDALWIVLGGVFFAFDMGALNAAILLSTPATASLISNTTPLFVGVISLFAFGKRQAKRFWFGFALALLGSAAIVGIDGFRSVGTREGDAWAFASAASFGCYLLLTERTRARVPTLTFAALSTMSSAIVLGTYCLSARLPLGNFSSQAWTMLVLLGLVPQVGGYFALGRALGKLSAATVSVSLLMQAVVTALLSVVVLHDRLSVAEIAGGAIVLAGVGIVNVPKRERTATSGGQVAA